MFKSGYKLIEVAPGDSGDLGFTRWRLSRDSEFAGEADGFDLVGDGVLSFLYFRRLEEKVDDVLCGLDLVLFRFFYISRL